MSRTIVLVGAVALLATGFGGAAGSQPPYVLAYAGHTSDDTTVINVVRADGSETRALTDGTGLDLPDAWSPDATRLVFERLDASRTYTSLFTVGLDGSAPVGIGSSSYDENPAWSPDGRWLAFQEQTDFGSGGGRADTTFDLWVTRPDRTHLTRVGSGDTDGPASTKIPNRSIGQPPNKKDLMKGASVGRGSVAAGLSTEGGPDGNVVRSDRSSQARVAGGGAGPGVRRAA